MQQTAYSLPVVAIQHCSKAEGCEILIPTLKLLISLVRTRRWILIARFVVQLSTHAICFGEVRGEVLSTQNNPMENISTASRNLFGCNQDKN